MRHDIARAAFAAAFLVCAFTLRPTLVRAAVPTGFASEDVKTGLADPTGIAFVPGPQAHGTRLLFVEQATARIRLLVNSSLSTLAVVPGVTTGSERGLLGIAVDPRWPAKPFIYLHHTGSGSVVKVVRYTVGGDVGWIGSGGLSIDLTTRREILNDIPDNAFNHNGGTVRFGPDSLLYASFGDDAAGCLALDATSLRGAILRVDVRGVADGGGPAPAKATLVPPGNPYVNDSNVNARLVFANGLRNPFRFHVDPLSGALLVADVGEGSIEEIDWVTSGANAGWPFYEGPQFNAAACSPLGGPYLAPIHYWDHNFGVSAMSLGVYRRPASGSSVFPPAYEGDAFVADYFGGFIRRLNFSGTSWAVETAGGQPAPNDWGTGFDQIVDAAQAPDGSLWYCIQSESFADSTGRIGRIFFVTSPVDAPPPSLAGLAFAPPSPQPARGPVRLSFSLARPGEASLDIHDAAGRHVRSLANGRREAGAHVVTWDGADDRGAARGPGLYFARLRSGGQQRAQRIVLTR